MAELDDASDELFLVFPDRGFDDACNDIRAPFEQMTVAWKLGQTTEDIAWKMEDRTGMESNYREW